MGIRRLAHRSANALNVNEENWTVQATETYSALAPADSPSSWGSSGDIDNLDRDFDATGSATTHLGYLATIVDGPDQLNGAIVKVQATYGAGEDPQIELWTHDMTNGWVKRRRLDVPTLARSGEVIIIDLTLSLAASLSDVDMVWITLVPTATETLSWIAVHLYGDCTVQNATPDCPPFSEPPDCSFDWPMLPGGGPLDPGDDPNDPEVPDFPGGPPTDFPFPPVLVEVLMPPSAPTSATENINQPYFRAANGHWAVFCPGPNRITMFFSTRGGGSVTVNVIAPGIVTFLEGTTQNISGSGSITWTVDTGFNDVGFSPRGPFLPPRALQHHITFQFIPHGNFDVLDLLDWEQFLWTYSIGRSTELC